MKNSVYLLIIWMILLLGTPAISHGENSHWANLSFDREERLIFVESQEKCVLEVRQGGKKVFSHCITAITEEVRLSNQVKNGEFRVSLFPLSYEKSESFGSQGTGLGEFLDPKGICTDITGKIIVVDSGNDRIQVFNSSLEALFEFGGFNWQEEDTSFNYISNTSRGSFNVPEDAAVTIKDVFVTDRENNRIKKFDLSGNFLLSFGGPGKNMGQMSYPMGIASDLMGNIYVADSRNDRIQKFDINGNFILEIGGFGYAQGRMNSPSDLVIDSEEMIHVLDRGNHRIQIFDKFGHFKKEFPLTKKGRFNSVTMLFDEIIVLSNSREGLIQFYSKNGDVLDSIGNLESPAGICVDKDNTLYVVESGSSSVISFKNREKQSDWMMEL